MTRYLVNAVVEVDAWTYVDAETADEAIAQAQTLSPSDFERGDPVHVWISHAEGDE